MLTQMDEAVFSGGPNEAIGVDADGNVTQYGRPKERMEAELWTFVSAIKVI